MSARRCSGCGASVRKPHEALCPIASKKGARNFATPPPEVFVAPRLYALPAAPTNPEIADQERTLLSFYRPAGGDA